MELFPELEKRYTNDVYTAREAQRMAEFIAFGPMVFQASRLMLKSGILDALRASRDGLTIAEIKAQCGLTEYAVKVLVEASLSIGTVLVDPKTDRYTVSKIGWFLLNDDAARANMDFSHDVNYEGMFYLEEALREGRPSGLRHFGDWPTIYEGLSGLPAKVQESWFRFDHFYSDNSFEPALEIIFSAPVRRLIDVGGNTGKWALKCVAHDENVKVTIMDLPQQIALMKKAIAGKRGAGRIEAYPVDMLDATAAFPRYEDTDVIWMSQFLDCFSEKEILSILERAAAVMTGNSRLCIMELLWNRQRFEPAALCLTLTSLYFTAMANGNSKMYCSEDLTRLIYEAGMEVEKIYDCIGQGHSILVCRKTSN